MKLRWWLLGAGGAYVGYKVLATHQEMIHATVEALESKIRFHRERAQKGDKESLKYLRSLDAAVERIGREKDSTDAYIIMKLQYDGLYPPSAI